jgi:dTMP kinase
MFFSFDGLDGVGKSTQLDRFCQSLTAAGHDVVRCADPGSTPLGDAIRVILLDRKEIPLCRTSEMLLFMAARAEMVDEIIAPALERGQTVVSDRFLLANVVYQGHAGGIDVDSLWQIGRMATRGLEPDLTFVLDMPEAAAINRIQRGLDRLESRGAEFQARLRVGFQTEAARRPERVALIDAARPIDVVAAEVWERAQPALKALAGK